jgi:DHA1 family multidrug resistance protein-like MFS transporter
MIDPSTLEHGHGSPEKNHQALSIGAGKQLPPPLPDSNQYVVEFDGTDDPTHPMNWTLGTK